MNEERDKRKLSAVLSADAKGYSRLMGEDESGTVRTLKEYREIMAKLIRRYRGRVVDSPGDNLLAEYASVVDAVDSAVEIQKELKLKNDELPENRRMEFRIGVNLGDVVEDGESIYGDGVNIAARVERLADGGGVCISGTAYDQIGKKLPFGYEYLGEQTVKNIEKPVRVYRVLMESEAAGKVIGEKRFLGGISRRTAISAIIILIMVAGALIGWNIYLHQSKRIEPASLDKMAHPLPDKPSIAVLPFDNMSEDPKHEYFADAVSENIITALSKIEKLFVIARNSTFTYKGKPVKVQKIAEDLGVRNVLEGSVQISEGRVRITAQLIDALNGKHLWAEKYDRLLEDLFALQDEITMKILIALQVELTEGVKSRVYAKTTTNLDAYLKFLKARKEYSKSFTKETNAQARQWYQEAVALDPQFSAAYAGLGWTHMYEARYGWSKSRSESMKYALELAQKAIDSDENHIIGCTLLSYIYRQKKQYDKSIAEMEKVINHEPNNASSYAQLAARLYVIGRGEEAIAAAKKAIRLNPIPEAYYFYILGNSHLVMAQYEEAISAYKNMLDRRSSSVALVPLTVCYSILGREEEAQASAAEVLRLDPDFSVGHWAKTASFKDKEFIERYINALHKAGLK